MKRNIHFLKILIGISCLFIYCQWLIYYFVLVQCDWPILNPHNVDQTIEDNNEKEVRALVFSDTHLLGSTEGHWLDKLCREWQMYRAFQTAIQIHNPDIVFILGDLTDEGHYCGEQEFNYYIKRFNSLFTLPPDTHMYVVVGNHDIGFHYRITPYLNQRFVEGFNSSTVQVITIRGNHFILINSMALEGDGCVLCKSAQLELIQIEKMLNCFKQKSSSCETGALSNYSRPILMQHFPLYRNSDRDCNEPDAAPFPLKNKKFREGWDCLTETATYQLLKQIEPRLVVSGHTHHGCTRNLTTGGGIEITLPSFSWRNKNSPSYGLFVFACNNYAFSKCLMPRESTVIICYVFGVVGMLVWIILCTRRNRKLTYL